MTLQQFAETVYFPNIKTKKTPSTYKGYFNLYSKQIQPRIGGLRLSTCSTADMQRILYRSLCLTSGIVPLSFKCAIPVCLLLDLLCEAYNALLKASNLLTGALCLCGSRLVFCIKLAYTDPKGFAFLVESSNFCLSFGQ